MRFRIPEPSREPHIMKAEVVTPTTWWAIYSDRSVHCNFHDLPPDEKAAITGRMMAAVKDLYGQRPAGG